MKQTDKNSKFYQRPISHCVILGGYFSVFRKTNPIYICQLFFSLRHLYKNLISPTLKHMLLDNQSLKKKKSLCYKTSKNLLIPLSSDRFTHTTIGAEIPTIVIAFFCGINFLAIVQAAEQSFNQSFSCGLLRNSFSPQAQVSI